MKSNGKPKGAGPVSKAKNTVKFFHKNIVEGKTIIQCAKELDISESMLHRYKKSDDFRQMAIEHLENSKLKGLTGTVSKLVKALDAKRPMVTEDCDGSTKITMVPDPQTQIKALQEVIKIYGLHAPVKKDVTATISISSDADIFREIEQAERASRYVESYTVGETGSELAPEQQGNDHGTPESRGRTLLQECAVPEP